VTHAHIQQALDASKEFIDEFYGAQRGYTTDVNQLAERREEGSCGVIFICDSLKSYASL